jgi:hypothetical protein
MSSLQDGVNWDCPSNKGVRAMNDKSHITPDRAEALGQIIDVLLEESLLEIDEPTDQELEEAHARVEEQIKEVIAERIKERFIKVRQANKPTASPTASRRSLFGLKE